MKHWFQHNYIRPDRHHKSVLPEKKLVTLTEDKFISPLKSVTVLEAFALTLTGRVTAIRPGRGKPSACQMNVSRRTAKPWPKPSPGPIVTGFPGNKALGKKPDSQLVYQLATQRE
mgnify:CR=1 FL=1